MESTGTPGKIHISQATAELLGQACKSKWILPRDEIVNVKGKGCVSRCVVRVRVSLAFH